MNKHLIEVITSVPQKLFSSDKHLTFVLFINNIIDMNIYKKVFTWKNIFSQTRGSCTVEQ